MMNEELLHEIQQQGYPLQVSREAAELMVECIGAIMDMVHEDDKILVRGDYALVTAALHHPDPDHTS